MSERPTVAVFRPDDERMTEAVALLEDAGAEPVPDPMLAIEPTGRTPADADAAVVVFTSKTGAELVADAGWTPGDAAIAAIGQATADALRRAGYDVDVVPEEYSSAGLVAALADRVAGERVEVARSDHGSDVLLDGLAEADADVHETVLYRLTRPPEAGDSAELAAAGEIDAALFTSSLTVEHFLDAAAERGVAGAARSGLDDATVGAIGEPTAETLVEHGLSADVVPPEASLTALVEAAVSSQMR